MHLSRKIEYFLKVMSYEEQTSDQISEELLKIGIKYSPRQCTAFINNQLINKFVEKRKYYSRPGESYRNLYRIIPGRMSVS